VIYEEFVELTMRTVGILIDLSSKSLAKDKSIDEAT
jgi:hypothetical protein